MEVLEHILGSLVSNGMPERVLLEVGCVRDKARIKSIKYPGKPSTLG